MASNYQPQKTIDLGGNFEDLNVVKVLLLEDDIHLADVLKTYL